MLDQRQCDALKLLTAGGTLEEVLAAICLAIEREAIGTLASVLLLDPATQRLVLGAAPSLPPLYNEAIDGIRIGDHVGSCGTAVARRTLVVVEDIATDPLWDSYRELALFYNLRACWSQPILSASGAVLGTFALYSREAQTPAATDLDLIEQAALLARLAVERYETERALRAAQDAAERANTARTRFLAAVSHDLRQPIQAQVLFQHMLAQQNRDPKLAPVIDKMGQSLTTQQQMLDTLLDISRLEAGVVTVEKVAFPIDPLLASLAAEFHPQATAHDLRLDRVACTVIVYSDPHLLERILRNLLANAVRYTDRGRILLGCRRTGQGLRVQVWDTGRGIPQNHLHAIFDEFYQVDNPARDRSKGLGLGLSIVDRLVRLIGCRITVRSTESSGTMFEVEVPLANAVREGHAVMRQPDCSTHGGHEVVMVIDDDPQVLQALQLCLMMMGHTVIAAADVENAVAQSLDRQQSPDVIVADYRLSHGQTGSEAVQALRATFGKAIPGVLLTGDTSPERLKEAQDSGLHVLHKPIKPPELNALLRTVRMAPMDTTAAPLNGGPR